MGIPHKFFQIDLNEYLNSPECDLSRYDYIFHLAGNSHPLRSVENPIKDFNINLKSTLLILESLRKITNKPKLINMSSGAIYGNPQTIPIKETDIPMPLSPYGVSKMAAGKDYVRVFSKLYGINAVSLRPFSVYGPHLQKQVIYDLIHKISFNSKELEVYGNGLQLRDFIYIKDLIEAMVLIALKGKTDGEVYNIASGTSNSINEIVNLICEAMNAKPQINYTGKMPPGEPSKWVVDITRIKELGFSPKVLLKEGIKQTVSWFKAENMAGHE